MGEANFYYFTCLNELQNDDLNQSLSFKPTIC